jgi:hypothetical protein
LPMNGIKLPDGLLPQLSSPGKGSYRRRVAPAPEMGRRDWTQSAACRRRKESDALGHSAAIHDYNARNVPQGEETGDGRCPQLQTTNGWMTQREDQGLVPSASHDAATACPFLAESVRLRPRWPIPDDSTTTRELRRRRWSADESLEEDAIDVEGPVVAAVEKRESFLQ